MSAMIVSGFLLLCPSEYASVYVLLTFKPGHVSNSLSKELNQIVIL